MRKIQTLHCDCCEASYVRGAFKCCAPPSGTPSHVWLGRYCRTCNHCPHHCACEIKNPREQPLRPLAAIANAVKDIISGGNASGLREWMPFKDNREPGDDDA